MKQKIGVDLDGTLAHSLPVFDPNLIGEPIAKMVTRVKAHIDAGDEVVIFTSRVAINGETTDAGTANEEFAEKQMALIKEWLLKVFGTTFAITAIKSPTFSLFYDDRAVQIIQDQGETVHEALGRVNVEKIVKRQLKKARARK